MTDIPLYRKGKAYRWLAAHVGYESDDCLVWPFHTRWNGYGGVKYAGKIGYPHRLMCIWTHGEPPSPEFQAAHSCGNGSKGCVNPRHLSWKSPQANMLERRQHGTAYRKQHWSKKEPKTTPEQVIAIRELKGKLNQRVIAKLFDTSYQNVSVIQRGTSRSTVKAVKIG